MADGMGKPPLTLEERIPNQAWIFSSVETPLHMFQEYMSPEWQGKFNVSPVCYICPALRNYAKERIYPGEELQRYFPSEK
ncbi:hypothetical protein DPMN_118437 [Dreissena polymorpha]|uniref:Uncharacterized protein n=1 Tax=Dreissena polymorpha TaxID=45954 RepID=A0A9D4GHE5_DREPO|nr:hypothetical protein DPMN_118437 [Dreissena polymorpha]